MLTQLQKFQSTMKNKASSGGIILKLSHQTMTTYQLVRMFSAGNIRRYQSWLKQSIWTFVSLNSIFEVGGSSLEQVSGSMMSSLLFHLWQLVTTLMFCKVVAKALNNTLSHKNVQSRNTRGRGKETSSLNLSFLNERNTFPRSPQLTYQ